MDIGPYETERRMEMVFATAPTAQLHELCIRNGWFDCGTNTQYEKLFEANVSGFSIEEIATIIWLCSSEPERYEIIAELKLARAAWTRRYVSVPEEPTGRARFHVGEINRAKSLAELARESVTYTKRI